MGKGSPCSAKQEAWKSGTMTFLVSECQISTSNARIPILISE